MNFSAELLLPQFGGKFSAAWIADVRGIAYVNKKDVIEVNIPELCNGIIEMLNYSDRRPEECLSLMLASRLVHGVIILFEHRVTVLLNDVIKFSYKCRIPKLRSPSDSKKKDDTTTSKKRKRKNKAEKRLAIECAPVDPAAQDGGFTNAAALEDITMNEVPLQACNELNDFQSEVLNFGDIGYNVQPGPFPLDDVVFPMIGEVESSNKQAFNDVLTTPSKKRPPTEVLTTPTKKRAVETQLEDQIIPTSPIEIVEKPVTPPLQNVEPAVAPQEQESYNPEWLHPKFQVNIETETKRKGKGTRLTKSNEPFCMYEQSNKCIDRLMDENHEIIPQLEQLPENFTRFPKHVTVDIPNLLAILFHDLPHIDDHIYRKQHSISHVESVAAAQKLSPRHTTFPLADLTSIGEASHEQSHQLMVPMEVEAPFFADPNISDLEGKESRVDQSHQFEVPVEVHASHCGESNIVGLNGREQFPLPAQTEFVVSAVEPVVAEKSPFEVIFPQNDQERKSVRRLRHKHIRYIVKNWNYEKNELTLEDICPKPINRFNIAATFADLLTMDKHGYVTLIGNEHTLELKAIEKGPKLLK